MQIQTSPTGVEKLVELGDATQYEPAGDQPAAERKVARRTRAPGEHVDLKPCITHVATPTGRKPVLKAMMTTACEKDCFYCPFRAGRGKMKRLTFQPDEMAKAFDQLQRAGEVDGIFLSSGIINGGVTTQDKIIDTIEIIRRRYHYRGYVHLKIMPGSEYDQLYRAMQLADRVSINLEGPTQERLYALAPKKDFSGDLLQRLAWAHDLRQRNPRLRTSTVTQFVVGAVGDTDLELLGLTSRLYRQMGLQRAYYSAFDPVSDTPFENLSPVSAIREHRLYQASFLLRDYAWEVEDLPFVNAGNLRLDVDPKRAWAEANLPNAPVEVMSASREELMRVPGIGPKGADAILGARRQGNLSELSHLRALGIRGVDQLAPYILLDGHRPTYQLRLI